MSEYVIDLKEFVKSVEIVNEFDVKYKPTEANFYRDGKVFRVRFTQGNKLFPPNTVSSTQYHVMSRQLDDMTEKMNTFREAHRKDTEEIQKLKDEDAATKRNFNDRFSALQEELRQTKETLTSYRIRFG